MTEEEWELVKTVKPFSVGHPDSVVMTFPLEAREALGDKVTERYAVYIRHSDGCVLFKPLIRSGGKKKK